MTRNALLAALVLAPLAGVAFSAPADAQAAGAGPAQAAPHPTAGLLTYSQALTPDAIRLIQNRLHDAGVFNGAADGAWGADSLQALRVFQQTRGLQATGEMNQATAVTLGINPVDLVSGNAGSGQPGEPAPAPQAGTAAPAPAGVPTGEPTGAPPGAQPGMAPPPGQPAPAAEHRSPVPLSRNALRLIQSRLREQGFYFGGIDGVWGPGSQSALVHLQQARGIPVSGRIDAASVQALGFDPNNFPPQ